MPYTNPDLELGMALDLSQSLVCAGGEFRTRDLQIMSIALVGEPLEFTN